MSFTTAPPTITKIRLIVLATDSRASGPNYSNSYCRVARFLLYDGIQGGYVYPYSTNDVTASHYYSSSYLPYYAWDSSYSSFWYTNRFSNSYKVSIDEVFAPTTWQDPNWVACHWNEYTLHTPVGLDHFTPDSNSHFTVYPYNYAHQYPTLFVAMGCDTNNEWHMLLDRSSNRLVLENYASQELPMEAQFVPAYENYSGISGKQSTHADSAIASNWYMYVRSGGISGSYNIGLDAYARSPGGTAMDTAIHGVRIGDFASLRSAIGGKSSYLYEQTSALLAKSVNDLSVGILSSMPNIRGCAITGGDTFGSRYLIPLSDKIPLRLSCVWGEYKTVKAIPHLYGTVSVAPIPYDANYKQFVVADHPIQSVQEVYVNDIKSSSYEFINTSDNTGHAIALITFVDSKETDDDIRVVCTGKLHPITGGLLLNPAEVLWDILANISGLEIVESDLADFRDSCYQLGIESHGGVIDANKTIRSQIDEVMASVGGIWSGGMDGIAKVYPFSEVI